MRNMLQPSLENFPNAKASEDWYHQDNAPPHNTLEIAQL